jgi:3-isopropylmalate dehydrogenase
MMLDWLGRRRDHGPALRASGWIEDAVAAALRDGSGLTVDLGGSASTADAGAAVLRALDAAAAAA